MMYCPTCKCEQEILLVQKEEIMIKTFCDRCGKEIIYYGEDGTTTYKLNGSLSIGTTSDLCIDCWSEILKRIENVAIKERKDL